MMPTPCDDCNEVVDFQDMVNVAKAGAGYFVCRECATEYEEGGHEDD